MMCAIEPCRAIQISEICYALIEVDPVFPNPDESEDHGRQHGREPYRRSRPAYQMGSPCSLVRMMSWLVATDRCPGSLGSSSLAAIVQNGIARRRVCISREKPLFVENYPTATSGYS